MAEGNKQKEMHVPSVQLPENLATIKAELTLHSGLLPPPETVERYELVLPGAFDRILTVVEEQQRATIAREDRLLTVHERDSSSNRIFAHCGQIFGFTIVVLFFVLLGFTVWINNVAMFSAVFAAGAIAGLPPLVRSFQKKSENQNKP